MSSNLIDLNNIKESCRHCEGTGIIKHNNDRIGTICSCCRGKGYLIFEEGYITKIVKRNDLFTEDRYRIINKWQMIRNLTLFREIVKRNDIEYVAFANNGILGTTNQWYDKTSNIKEVIPYEDYLDGSLPLPDEKILCPHTFYDYPFNNSPECIFTCTEKQKDKCWQEFYKYTENYEEKQKIISSKIKKLTPKKSQF